MEDLEKKMDKRKDKRESKKNKKQIYNTKHLRKTMDNLELNKQRKILD